jgi:drug/metabolite transporter (DMT)-like permease
MAKLLAGRIDAMQLTFLRWGLLLAAFALTTPFSQSPGAAWRRFLFLPRARAMRLAGLGVICSPIMAIVGAAMTRPAMPFFWIAPTGVEWPMIGAFAAVQAVAQVALAMALQRAEMAGLQPWQYVNLAWALAFDLLLFGLSPDIVAVFGIGLILGGTALAAAKPGRGR